MKPNKTIEKILDLYSEKDSGLILKAFELADKAHKEQKRESGDAYIIHPLDTALTLAKMNMDPQTIAAAILHDVVDDTSVTLAQIKKEFGQDIAFLVDGVSKLGKLKYQGTERHAENLRKMLVATAKDVRVILIKFADRLHNMKTLEFVEKNKQHRIALETLEIYAPIAKRLGVSELGRQLEDLAFPFVYPDEYDYIKKESNYRIKDSEKFLKKLSPALKKALAEENIMPIKIEMRAKHYFSLRQKLKKYNNNWSMVYDLVAMRIIVEDLEACYKTLGVIHKLWKPVPGRIKDFIALPKPNGYQSLHTTVFALGGKQTEFQIRTPQMHKNAEFGIAAHWQYKGKKGKKIDKFKDIYSWVNQLKEWDEEKSHTDDFIESLKIDVFSDRIFVFTPKGDALDLPSGATIVDFAYQIHSGVGDKCSAAIVNEKMVPLRYELQNGDVVQIITSKNKVPSQAWLNFVKTRNAKTHIKKWLKSQNREQNIKAGEDLLNEELKAVRGLSWNQLKDEEKNKILNKFSMSADDDLFLALGQGDLSINRIIANLIEESEKKIPIKKKATSRKEGALPITIAGVYGLKMHIAQCCNPLMPEEIAAYITIEHGASIHKIKCPNLSYGEKDNKIIPAYWTQKEKSTPVSLEMKVANRVGMLQEISSIIASLNINILEISTVDKGAKNKKSEVKLRAKIEVGNLNQLKNLYEKLRGIEGVLEIKRS